MERQSRGPTARSTALAAAIGLTLASGAALAQSSQVNERTGSTSSSVGAQERTSSADDARRSGLDSNRNATAPSSAAQNSTAQGAAASLESLEQRRPDLSTFVSAVKSAGLENSLTNGTEYTVFAPTNDAFDKGKRSVDELMKPENRPELIEMLRAHIVADDVDPSLAQRIHEAATIDGGTIDLKSQGSGDLEVGNAKVVDAQGIELGALRIYPIDGVLASNAPSGGSGNGLGGVRLETQPSGAFDAGHGSGPQGAPRTRSGG
jgi:uncharacterized surface protein with fasciclin (FAS1) repeats